MTFDPLTAAFEAGKILIEKIWPDPAKQAEEMRKLQELQQKGGLAELNAHVQLLAGQIEINKIEAQHPNIFVSGWRPAIGWVAALALALMYIPKAIVMTVIWTMQCYELIQVTSDISKLVLPSFPELGAMDIIGLVVSMLGVASMRSIDKFNGVDTKQMGKLK